jgi:hypothetical protein
MGLCGLDTSCRSAYGRCAKLPAHSGENQSVIVAFSGQVSPRLRDELAKRGFIVQDRLAPGPLK